MKSEYHKFIVNVERQSSIRVPPIGLLNPDKIAEGHEACSHKGPQTLVARRPSTASSN